MMKPIRDDEWTPEPNTGCWLWSGALIPAGYGVVNAQSRGIDRMAHRAMYEQAVGPIAPGLVLDHRCRNRACVNPDHLEPVTVQENVLRGLRGRMRTHCKHGHEYTPETTWFDRYADGRMARRCRICKLETNRNTKNRKRKRVQAAA